MGRGRLFNGVQGELLSGVAGPSAIRQHFREAIDFSTAQLNVGFRTPHQTRRIMVANATVNLARAARGLRINGKSGRRIILLARGDMHGRG